MLLFLDHIKTTIKELILPPASSLLLAVIGALLLRRRPRVGGVLLALGIASLWVLSLPAVGHALVRWTQHYPALDPTRPTGAQAIVILGGGGQRAYAPEYGGPAAGPYLLEKLTYGAYLARHTGLPILVTGWHVEAAAMRDSLQRNFGLQPRWVDAQAYDTFDNARNAARLLRAARVHRIILLTSTTHMWRAAHEFCAAGLAVVAAPVGVLGPQQDNAPALLDFMPDPKALEESYEAVYEMLGERVRVLLALMHLRRQSTAS